MNKPVVLDQDRTCYNCKPHSRCYAFRVASGLLSDWRGYFEHNSDQPNWQTVYVALAAACTAFELPPPTDLDEPAMETYILQVTPDRLDDLELAESNLDESATLYTHDMKEVT